MKLPKHELNKYHIGLQECIITRKEWLHYYQIKMRWKKLKKEVHFFMSKQKPLMSLFLFFIYLPSIIFKFLESMKISYELKQVEKEIEVLEKELIYVDSLRWSKENNQDLKLLK